MKTFIFLIAFVTVCFACKDKPFCSVNHCGLGGVGLNTDTITLNDLVYRDPNIKIWNNNDLPKILYTTPAENNDTTYTVVKKESEYLIIREYKVIDTVKVKVVK